jgi:hypothetical protein
MISKRDLSRAEYIIFTSGAVDLLINGYRTTRRGRPANRKNMHLMLLGLFLSVHKRRVGTLTGALAALREELSIDDQLRLGVITLDLDPDGSTTVRPLVTENDFYNLERAIRQGLTYSHAAAPDISAEERARRHEALRTVCDALLDVFDLGWSTHTVAMDATGIWSWGRGYSDAAKPKKRSSAKADDDMAVEEDDFEDEEELDLEKIAAEMSDDEKMDEVERSESGPSASRTKRRDLEAGWGVKTGKNGKTEPVFGYHEHTLVQVPDGSDEKDTVPPLIRRFELTPANVDVVDVSLNLLDRYPLVVTDLIVDRHYHFKRHERWKAQLSKRGIRQHLDLREDEHGFTEASGLRWAAGAAHCPATPDHLATIKRPGLNPTAKELEAFNKLIQERNDYAMTIHTQPDENGTMRVSCPAVTGKVGCPLRPDTVPVAIRQGLRRVENPPTAADYADGLPACCTQRTVKVTPPPSVHKLQQPHYWGTPEWRRMWDRRTYVEGSYGNRKNPSTENLRRGHFQVFGLVWVHLVMAMVNASYNLRMLENWCDRHPDHPFQDHPLVAPAVTATVGYLAVSAEELESILLARAA